MKKAYPNEERLHATGIERCFIACLMKFPNLVSSAEASVSPDDIYSPNFHVIYKTILRMKEHYDLKKTDYVFSQELICRWLESASQEDKNIFDMTVSNFSNLLMIQNAPGVDVESFGKYLREIKSASSAVMAYRTSIDLQDKIMNTDVHEAFKIVNDAEQRFAEIRSSEEESSIVRMGDCVDSLLEDAEFNRKNKGRVGIWLPEFPRLMKVLNGFRRSQFLILYARPKTGKSSLLLNFALATAYQNIPTLLIDTEMTQKEQASRAVSNWSGVKEWDIMGGEFVGDEEKGKAVKEQSDRLKKAPLYYIAAKGSDANKICACMKEFVEKYVGYETNEKGERKTRQCLIVYDWLKVADSDSLKQVKEYQELGFLATALNDTRRELDVPLIAGAQANRDGGMKNNTGVDAAAYADSFLADSDRLLRFCTCLIWLRRLSCEEAKMMKEIAEEDSSVAYNQMIHVVEQRGGPTCLEGIGLAFTGANLSYEEKDPIDLKKMKKEKQKRSIKEKKEALGMGEESNSEESIEGEEYATEI